MAITVLKERVPWGPFTPEAIRQGLERGDFTLQTLAHAPGLTEWRPLGEVLAHVERTFRLPPVPESSPALPPLLPALDAEPPARAVPVPPPLPSLPPVPDADETGSVKDGEEESAEEPFPDLEKASAFARLFAWGIDVLLLFVPVLACFLIGAAFVALHDLAQHASREAFAEDWHLLRRNLGRLGFIMATGGAWIYTAGMEASPRQATFGQQRFGLRVTGWNGRRIGFLRATCRYAAKYLSALPLGLGFIMALFSPRGLALHDRLTRTRVTKHRGRNP